ncbi:MAG: PorV/PorQ family protein [Melioribacteraceae bacterium]|nr:PorV/PorQ family protein [Melioribacteraceae bacterium]
MKLNKLKLFLIVLLSCVSNIYSQVGLDKLAQSTMNFLLVGVSPRASAMGEAFFAVNTGVESIFYNPAGLAESQNEFEGTVSYTQWIADINYLSGALAYNLGNIGTFGLSILTVDYGTINGTTLLPFAQRFEYPAGYIETGPVDNVGAYSFGISYAKAISQQFSIGGNLRYVGQSLGENKYFNGTTKKNDATKLVFDAGVKYNTGYKNFRFGMAIRNFSSQIKREEIDEQLPLTFTIGTAVDLFEIFLPEADQSTYLTLAVDYLHSNNFSERMNVGLEYMVLGRIYVRGGYQTNRDIASWSGGIGLSQSLGDYTLQVNYSYSQMDTFDNVNRLSLGFNF